METTDTKALCSISTIYLNAIRQQEEDDWQAMRGSNEKTREFFIDLLTVLAEDISIDADKITEVLSTIPELQAIS